MAIVTTSTATTTLDLTPQTPSAQSKTGAAPVDDESKVDDAVGILGMIIGVVALLVGVANMVVMNKAMQEARESKSGDNFEDDTGDKSLSSSKAPV